MNISLSEVILVVFIALLVIKPEQMPDVALKVGRFVKSLRRVFGKVKDEMNDLMESANQSNERQ